MKKFLKKAEGFTLVELIVVIAILGILTAIAVPTYSGYVKKAAEAKDTQYLSAANTAIAAAITENNLSLSDVATNLEFDDDDDASTDAGCTITVKAKTGSTSTEVQKDFVAYYGGDTITFEYYTGVTLDGGNLKGVAPTT